MDSLKQVEVVRSPASALWGSGALGGVVAFTTQYPIDYIRISTRFDNPTIHHHLLTDSLECYRDSPQGTRGDMANLFFSEATTRTLGALHPG